MPHVTIANLSVERRHGNGTTARVTYFPDGDVYQPAMWPPLRDGHVFMGETRADLKQFEAACSHADHLAHPDCDGTCPPWPEDPKRGLARPAAAGRPCPECGLPMTYNYPLRNSSVVIDPWLCENPECTRRAGN